MGVYIKNWSIADWKELLKWAKIGANNAMIGEFAEVEELPPHGDLIDRSELGIREAEKSAYEAYLREKQEFFIDEPLREYLRGRLDGLNHASGLVRFASTIIPATEGEI